MTSTPDSAPALTPAAPRWRFSAGDAFALAVLVVAALAIYLPTARFEFVNYDDQVYVYQNSHVLGGLSAANIAWACKAIVSSNWHPLTLLAELTISSLFGTGPGPFHAVNALLHAANVGLLFILLRRMTGRYWPAVLASALWGFHPLRVESVAWVSELKDVLCGTFTLLTLLAYVRYTTARTPARYAAVAGLLALAMLAKPMAVTVPAVLLLLDVWPLGRAASQPFGTWWRTRVLEKLPLAAITLADITYAIVTQFKTGSAGSLTTFPATARAVNAFVSTGNYLRQTVWPTGLAVVYPHPAMTGGSYPLAAVTLSAGALLAGCGLAVACLRRAPYVFVGWFWFLAMLVPVVGIVQIGEQARADRYTYLPSIGLTVAVVWALAALRPPALARLAGVAGGAAAAALLAASVVTVGYWHDTARLFDHADRVVPDNYQAMLVLADLARTRGDVATAIPLARRAVEMTGDRTESPRVTLGMCLLATGRDQDVTPALEQFVAAGRIRKIDPTAWVGMGRALARQAEIFDAQGRGPAVVRDRVDHAIGAYRQALKLNPDNTQAAGLLANLLDAHGQSAEALDVWRFLLDRFPADPIANGDVAAALQKSGDTEGATDHYLTAVQNGDPRPATASRLAWLLAINGGSTPDQLAFVAPLAKRACDDPTAGNQPFPWYAYSVVLARLDRINDATAAGEKALVLAKASGHDDEMAKAIQSRLSAYRQGLVALPSTRPTTAPVLGPMAAPTTRPASTEPAR